MPADRMLNTVLQLYQDVHDATKTEQIIGTTTHLLAHLSNPLNLGVVTSQLLTAPALWQQHQQHQQHQSGLRVPFRIISIYNTAAARVRANDVHNAKGTRLPKGDGVRPEAWVRAVVKGADDRSRRWQHLLVLTGVLLGMEGHGEPTLSRSLRNTLGQAVVMAANLALEQHLQDGPVAAASVVMALNYAFPLLDDHHKAQLDCDALLPLVIWGITAEDGFADGQFLLAAERDTISLSGGTVTWPIQSASFRAFQDMDKRPLVGSIGPLAKLAAFAIQHARHTTTVLQAQDAVLAFSGKVLQAWAATRFSQLDQEQVAAKLSPETLQKTWPALWERLRKLLFATVIMLQAVVARSLLDPLMLRHAAAPAIASNTLRILRHLYFISSRNSNSAFQVYSFVYLTSIDVLTQHHPASQMLLEQFQPAVNPSTSVGSLQRNLDLFYLNLAEHMPLSLSTAACEPLLVKPALAYISYEGPTTQSMVQLFESAHSAILSVLSCPQHSELTIKMAPFYIVKLFESFPARMSTRQFRFAFKTVLQVVSPPFPIAAMEPHLCETLLEMLRSRIEAASTDPLPPKTDASQSDEPLSEQSSLVFALIDSMPFLPLPLVEEWLTVASQTLHLIGDPRLRDPVKQRFWSMLVSGELDIERASIGVAWWGTKGGRELVLSGGDSQPAMMSGAIVSNDHQSRL